MKIAKLNIEGYIGGADIMSMFSGEETFNLSKLKKFIDGLESDVTDIHVFINSGGGSVNEGWAIYDKLKASGKTITTIGEGMVGSIATIIYMAGSVRKLHENSKFFIHNPYWQADAPTPMEGDDLIALGEDLKNEQKKILDFYALQTGTDLSSIEPLMSKATDLTSEQAIEMGFAHEVIGGAVNYRKYQLVAMVAKKEKQTKTNIMEQTLLNRVNKLFKNMGRAAKGKYFDMDITATDSEGKEVSLQVESDTEDLTGKPAFIVDAEGNQTPAPDGDYKDAEGKVIKVAEGKVTEVVAKVEDSEPADDVEALKAEIAALKAEKETLSASVLAKTEEVETVKASTKVIEAEFVALKKVIIGEGAEFDTATQEFKAKKVVTEDSNSSFLNELANNIKKSK